MNLKEVGKILTSKFVGTMTLCYEKKDYRAAVSQRLRNTGLNEKSRPSSRRMLYCCNWNSIAFSNLSMLVLVCWHLIKIRAIKAVQKGTIMPRAVARTVYISAQCFNPLNPELNPICYLLALLGAHHFLHVRRIRVKLLTFRRLKSCIYGAPILDVSRSHTTTQHSR